MSENDVNEKAAQAAQPAVMELPRYRRSDVVQAARIVEILPMPAVDDQGRQLELELVGPDQQPATGRVFVDQQFVEEMLPVVGGWFCRNADGHPFVLTAEQFASYQPEPCGRFDEPSPLQPVRQIESHKVNDANSQLTIDVMDERGSGGASHLYQVSGFNTASNPSCPFMRRYGKPAEHATILFQNGPIKEAGVNGITQEALLAILIDRLADFQNGQFACGENAMALAHLRHAVAYLEKRTRGRVRRGVEGTHEV